MKIKLYNTLSREKEDFKPIDEKRVKIYSCGPTVYSYPHIGNFRAYLFMDSLRRVLKYNGYELVYLSYTYNEGGKSVTKSIDINETLSFVMPDSEVTVNGAFRKKEKNS